MKKMSIMNPTGKYGVDMEDIAPLASKWLDEYSISDLETLAP